MRGQAGETATILPNADRSSVAEFKTAQAFKDLIDEHGLELGNKFTCGEIGSKTGHSAAVVGGYLRRYSDGVAARLTGMLGVQVTLIRTAAFQKRSGAPVYWCVVPQ